MDVPIRLVMSACNPSYIAKGAPPSGVQVGFGLEHCYKLQVSSLRSCPEGDVPARDTVLGSNWPSQVIESRCHATDLAPKRPAARQSERAATREDSFDKMEGPSPSDHCLIRGSGRSVVETRARQHPLLLRGERLCRARREPLCRPGPMKAVRRRTTSVLVACRAWRWTARCLRTEDLCRGSFRELKPPQGRVRWRPSLADSAFMHGLRLRVIRSGSPIRAG